jgi:hypothetical protein
MMGRAGNDALVAEASYRIRHFLKSIREEIDKMSTFISKEEKKVKFLFLTLEIWKKIRGCRYCQKKRSIGIVSTTFERIGRFGQASICRKI